MQRLDEAMLEILASQDGASSKLMGARGCVLCLYSSRVKATAIQHVLASDYFALRDFTFKISIILELMTNRNPPRKRYGLRVWKRRHSDHRVSDESGSTTESEVWNFYPHNY
jgi:hypothetical protein